LLDQPLTRPQALAILMMFNFGSSVVMGVSTGVAQDSWLALMIAAAYAMPVLWMYARIITLNPGEGLFSALENRLGKVLGKAATALMSWFALHLCALVLRNFSEFIQLSSMLETPQLPVLLIMATTVYMLARNGGKALGKWAVATIPIVLGIVVLTILFSFNIMRPDNFLPMLEHPIGKILKEAYMPFSFPLAETVVFLGIADFVRPSDNPFRIYAGGMLFSALTLLAIIARNLMILGPSVVSMEYFPSYSAVSIIDLGGFLSRIEGSISVNFMLTGITKIALCLITASRGIASLFGIRDWRKLVAPVALLSVMLAQILYKSTMEMFAFIDYYGLYAILFELAIPLLLWTVSELRSRKQRQGACAAGDPGDAAGCARTGD
jgi:spore germination protein KB